MSTPAGVLTLLVLPASTAWASRLQAGRRRGAEGPADPRYRAGMKKGRGGAPQEDANAQEARSKPIQAGIRVGRADCLYPWLVRGVAYRRAFPMEWPRVTISAPRRDQKLAVRLSDR